MRSQVLAESRLHLRYPSRPMKPLAWIRRSRSPAALTTREPGVPANRTKPQPPSCTSGLVLSVSTGPCAVQFRVGAVRCISMFAVFRPGVRDVCVGPQIQNAGTLEGAREEVAKPDVVLE